MNIHVYLVILTLFLKNEYCVQAWTSEELELFDLVEEINQNFYEVLHLDQSAGVSDIKKAYRRLSLQFHPDKNKDEGAEETFRNIVAVSEVLKDEERRKQYDLILQNGLPDWRQPIFYYRRVRKMGLFELFAFLSVFLTSGHFILLWAAYWEKKYELEEVLSARFKRKKPKKCKDQENSSDDLIASQVSLLPKPAFHDLLPALIVRSFVKCILELPKVMSSLRTYQQRRLEQKENLLEETEEDLKPSEKVRKPRKKVKTELPDYYSLAPTSINGIMADNNDDAQQYSEIEVPKPREWNEQDVIQLVKAMNRFPGGTPQRWEKIAASLKRTVEEVSVKVKSLKSSSIVSHPCTALQGVTGKEVSPLSNNTIDETYENTYDNDKSLQQQQAKRSKISLENQQVQATEMESSWSQSQQKSLEEALQKYPKGCEDRWDCIAEQVPGKTKEECLLRYKVLVELIKKKKSQTVL